MPSDETDGNAQSGQPSGDWNGGWHNPFACNYNVATGLCMGIRRVSHGDMTGQPSRNDEDPGSGHTAYPNVGTAAVTNPGETDHSRHSGGSGGSRIWDGVVDPEEIVPGPLPGSAS